MMRAASFPLCILFMALSSTSVYPQSPAQQANLQIERIDSGNGTELLTLFSLRTGSPQPVISVLRDTLGDEDPANDRIRFIWALNYSSPSLTQRLKASLPFFYRKSAKVPKPGKTPKPIVDYSAKGRRTVARVMGALLAREVSGSGFVTRSTSMSYRSNAEEYRKTRISQSLEAIRVSDSGSGFPDLSDEDLDRIKGKLILTQNLFGDLTSESYLSLAKEWNDRHISSTRAANWELLRQKAEENGLYFQPLHLGSP